MNPFQLETPFCETSGMLGQRHLVATKRRWTDSTFGRVVPTAAGSQQPSTSALGSEKGRPNHQTAENSRLQVLAPASFCLLNTHAHPFWGLPWWLRRPSVRLRCGRPGLDLWVGKIPWRRKWQPTPASLPGKFHGRRSLAGYSPWGPKELDMTEQVHFLSFLCNC